MKQRLEFDIAIVGGGMVGASLASLLAASGCALRIALIEAHPFAELDQAHYQPSFDARSTALSYGSAEILRELGLWENLSKHITPIKKVHVSDKGHLGGGMIDAAEQQLAAVGYVVENAWLGSVLINHVKACAHIHAFAPASVSTIAPQQTGACLTLTSGDQTQELFASLVVIADGGDSPLRRALGIATHTRDYQQTAIITNVEFSEPHNGIAYERFTADGPLALLPLGESEFAQQSALVWTLPSAQANAVLALDDAAFLAELQTRFGFRLGRFTRVAKRHTYPLQLVLAEEQVRSHIALIGNAAHFLHPVAGQGFNLALRDCACLVEVLTAAMASGENLGELKVLQAYLEQQQLDQKLTVEFSDRLVRLFSNNYLPAMALRHLGFLSLATFPFLKEEFIAQTMGTAGRQFRWREAVPVKPKRQNNSAPEIASNNFQQDLGDNPVFDVVIVGAGLVGASLACSIAQLPQGQNLRIAVIEASDQQQVYSGTEFDPRVVALTQASQNLLEKIHCWETIVNERACAYREMKVWDGEGTASIEFDCAEVRQPVLGHIVENSVAVNAVRARLMALPQVTLIQPASLVAIERNSAAASVSVQLSHGKSLSASLLIAADGAHSKVCDLAQFETREWDYGHKAIVASVRTEHPHQHTAWQRFMHTGPLAFLPLQEAGDHHYCSIVWSAEHELADELMQLNDQDFCVRLAKAFEYRLGEVTQVSPRFAIALRQRHATRYVQPNIGLVGDAAHNIHPLAGQGVNLGLLDVAALTDEIERALVRGLPLNDFSILRRYQRARVAGNLSMMTAMEGFKRLFASRSLAVNWLRNTGMNRVASFNGLKKLIVKAALGGN